MGEPWEESELTIAHLWHTVVKRRKLILTVLLITLCAVALWSFIAKPTYKASVTIKIEPAIPKILSFDEMARIGTRDEEFYQTQYKLLTSRTLAKRVVKRLNLADNPEFNRKVITLNPIALIKGLMGEKLGETDVSERAVSVFLSSLEIKPIKNTQLVKISFISHNPKLSAQVANAIAEEFINWSLESKYIAATRVSSFLRTQIEKLKKEIAEKEKELQKYSGKKEILGLGERENIILQKLADLNIAYTNAQVDRITKEAYYNKVKNASADSIPEVLKNPLIQELKAEYARLEREYSQKSKLYKKNWPGMIQLRSELKKAKERLDTEIRNVVAQVKNSARTEYLAALERERNLKRMLDEQKKKTVTLNLNSIEYNNLKSEVENKRALLASLLKKADETNVSAEIKDLKTSNIWIIDRAEVPKNVYRPNKKINLALGFILGLLLGIGGAFLLESMKNTIDNSDDVAKYLRLPTLGVIPSFEIMGDAKNYPKKPMKGRLISVKGEENLYKLSHYHPESIIAEAYKSLRTSLLLLANGEFSKTIMITSTQPGEGKSTVAMNLSIALAQSARRTLLIDSDLRNQKISHIFRTGKMLGLSNFLRGQAEPTKITYKTDIPNLYLIPAGTFSRNASELLDSIKLNKLLESYIGYFDKIILDSPPLIPVADAVILGSKVDKIVIVVLAEDTPRELILKAKEKLLPMRDKVLGVVLNNARLWEEDYYYYKRYYTYYSKGMPKKKVVLKIVSDHKNQEKEVKRKGK